MKGFSTQMSRCRRRKLILVLGTVAIFLLWRYAWDHHQSSIDLAGAAVEGITLNTHMTEELRKNSFSVARLRPMRGALSGFHKMSIGLHGEVEIILTPEGRVVAVTGRTLRVPMVRNSDIRLDGSLSRKQLQYIIGTPVKTEEDRVSRLMNRDVYVDRQASAVLTVGFFADAYQRLFQVSLVDLALYERSNRLAHQQ